MTIPDPFWSVRNLCHVGRINGYEANGKLHRGISIWWQKWLRERTTVNRKVSRKAFSSLSPQTLCKRQLEHPSDIRRQRRRTPMSICSWFLLRRHTQTADSSPQRGFSRESADNFRRQHELCFLSADIGRRLQTSADTANFKKNIALNLAECNLESLQVSCP